MRVPLLSDAQVCTVRNVFASERRQDRGNNPGRAEPDVGRIAEIGQKYALGIPPPPGGSNPFSEKASYRKPGFREDLSSRQLGE